MRVMCLSKDKPGDHPDLIAAAEQLQVGSVYTVIDEDEERYELAEFYHPRQIMWDKKHFAILPEPSTDDMQEEQREAIVNLETV